MIRSLVVTAVLLAATLSVRADEAAKPAAEKLVGVWHSTPARGEFVTMTYEPDGTFAVVIRNAKNMIVQEYGGKWKLVGDVIEIEATIDKKAMATKDTIKRLTDDVLDVAVEAQGNQRPRVVEWKRVKTKK